MQFRYQLGPPTNVTMHSNSYQGTSTVQCTLAGAPPNTWLKKRTRGLRVFYFLSNEAATEARLLQKKRKVLEYSSSLESKPVDKGKKTPNHFLLPLDPGGMLWFSFAVPPGSTVEEAVDDVLWSPICNEAQQALDWFVNYLSDSEIELDKTLHHLTKKFVSDYESNLDGGEPMGVLNAYIGNLNNDGSVHARRSPEFDFQCVV